MLRPEQYDLPKRFVRWAPPIVTEAVVSVTMIALVVGLRLTIDVFIEGVAPFVLIFPAIAGAVLLADPRSGATVLLGCQLVTWYMLLPHRGSFRFASFGDLVSLGLATIAQLLLLWAVANYRAAARSAAETDQIYSQRAAESAGHMQVLVAELQHRTRNVIALVRSLADKTIEGSASLEDFSAKFRGRLAALSRVQGLLSNLGDGERVAFDVLLRAELAAQAALEGENHVTLAGPGNVRLRSRTVQTLALALHELATNAVKYGALAQPKASLAVRWHVEPTGESDAQWLHIEWRESGVAVPVSAKATQGQGYGRELIERVLPYQLKARTSYQAGPDGVCCTIYLQIAGDAEASDARPS